MAYKPINYFKYDPVRDKELNISLKKALNDNWDHTQGLVEELRTNVDANKEAVTKKGNVDGFEKKNVSVDTSLWQADGTFPDYGFKARVPVSEATENHICTAFVPDHTNRALDGIFGGWTFTGTGYVEIFANVQPATFTIETLRFEKVVV